MLWPRPTLSEPMRDRSFVEAYSDVVSGYKDGTVKRISLDNGQLSKDEGLALRKWYASRPAERLHKLRSVYPLTIANEGQLTVWLCLMNL